MDRTKELSVELINKHMNSTKTYNCLSCGTENKWGHSKTNKYCDNVCKGEYEYHNIHVPLILEGKKNDWSKPLRRFILERDGNECTVCGQSDEWNGLPLTLQVDHIDGNSDNNMPDNLRTICPHCHTQTESWGAKGTGNKVRKHTNRNRYLQNYKR